MRGDTTGGGREGGYHVRGEGGYHRRGEGGYHVRGEGRRISCEGGGVPEKYVL